MTHDWFKGCKTKEDINTRYKNLAKQLHPDRGGHVEDMQDLNRAREEAIKRLEAPKERVIVVTVTQTYGFGSSTSSTGY